mmetsp:Transcript_7779/g.9955  ORF Transcript_7779/g.9955 Transcript_7779/m.9955 type:complete len:215 (-) Transcript_7779:49-693(-)
MRYSSLMINIGSIIFWSMIRSTVSCARCFRQLAFVGSGRAAGAGAVGPFGSSCSSSVPLTSASPPCRSMNDKLHLGATVTRTPRSLSMADVLMASTRIDNDCDGSGDDVFVSGNDDSLAEEEELINVDREEDVLSSTMVASIGFYKNFISPLLPPACRFFPTCSQYGVQAIQEFGPVKGGILTAWRILRCSPIGGKGYDPPRWPPCWYWGTGET